MSSGSQFLFDGLRQHRLINNLFRRVQIRIDYPGGKPWQAAHQEQYRSLAQTAHETDTNAVQFG